MKGKRPFLVLAMSAAMLSLSAPCRAGDNALLRWLHRSNKSAAPVVVSDPAQEEVEALYGRVRALLNNRNFDELERMAGEARRSRETMKDGSSKLYEFYGAFQIGGGAPSSVFENMESLFGEWMAKKPESVTAHVGYAVFLVNYIMYAPDGISVYLFSDEIPVQESPTKERLEACYEVLKKVNTFEEQCPMKWDVYSTLSQIESWDKQTIDAMYAEAKAFDPTFWRYDTDRAYTLLPRHFGNRGDWEVFAKQAAEWPGGLGAEVYARIVMRQSRFYRNIFKETKAEWPLVKEGLKVLLRKYPESAEIANRAAHLACAADDRAFAETVFHTLGNQYLPHVWEKAERFTYYRNWAIRGY